MSPTGKKRTGRSARSRRRVPAPPPWLSALLLLVATAAFVLVLVTNRERSSLSWLFRREQESASLGTFQEIRDLAQLETLAYVRRSVFPHDFLQPHLTVPGLLRVVAAADTTAAEALQPEELAHLRAANLAASLNLAGSRNDERFVVVTTTLIFGYDLDLVATGLENARIPSDADPDGSSIPLYVLPPPALLSVITENINRANYPFPPIHLDAEGWRRVTSFVEDHVTITAPMHELLRSAAENGRETLQALLGPEATQIRIRTGENNFPRTP
ncbi:MAG: hypothetical protein EA427_04275 [Spirochaetaceae bacterium]|nr:MAG: hypothetical protein EA427_04275 [Spirochaetaceae bacterium]